MGTPPFFVFADQDQRGRQSVGLRISRTKAHGVHHFFSFWCMRCGKNKKRAVLKNGRQNVVTIAF